MQDSDYSKIIVVVIIIIVLYFFLRPTRRENFDTLAQFYAPISEGLNTIDTLPCSQECCGQNFNRATAYTCSGGDGGTGCPCFDDDDGYDRLSSDIELMQSYNQTNGLSSYN